MNNSEDNIRKLLEMLDNPDAYSEQEIRDIIDRDEETRETYRMMVDIKCSSRRKSDDRPVDVDAAWKQFEDAHYSTRRQRVWMKIAAGFVGFLFVSGLSFATVTILRHHNERHESEQAVRIETVKDSTKIAVETRTDLTPVTFSNVPLEQILSEISEFYGVTVEYGKTDARSLRFYYEWNRQSDIDEVIDYLNRFAKLNITKNNNKLSVE